MSASGRIDRFSPDLRKGAARPEHSGQRDGDPGRIRTCDPQIRNLMLYPAELRGRSAGRPNLAVRPNPARFQASRNLDQSPSHRNAECTGRGRDGSGGPFIALHPRSGVRSCHIRPVSVHPRNAGGGMALLDMPKPLLIERNRDRDLVMLAMVEIGCTIQFDTPDSCILHRSFPRPERPTV